VGFFFFDLAQMKVQSSVC